MLMFIPTRELCRHFDGYHRRTINNIDINKCPPLFIPPGFWEKDIKIVYGERLSGYVNINLSKDYSCVSPDGTDIKTHIPLFWMDRIKKIIVNNEAVWDVANAVRERDIPSRSDLF